MTASNALWSLRKYQAFLLLYAAHGEVEFDQEEKQYILSRIEDEIYHNALHEFIWGNGYAQMQKMRTHNPLKKHYPNDVVMQSINSFFNNSKALRPIEKMVLSAVSKLLNY